MDEISCIRISHDAEGVNHNSLLHSFSKAKGEGAYTKYLRDLNSPIPKKNQQSGERPL